jgi:hypothetical protein
MHVDVAHDVDSNRGDCCIYQGGLAYHCQPCYYGQSPSFNFVDQGVKSSTLCFVVPMRRPR